MNKKLVVALSVVVIVAGLIYIGHMGMILDIR